MNNFERQKVHNRVRNVVAEILGVRSDIDADTLIKELGGDSLDNCMLCMDIEDAFDINLPDDEIVVGMTLRGLMDKVVNEIVIKDDVQEIDEYQQVVNKIKDLKSKGYIINFEEDSGALVLGDITIFAGDTLPFIATKLDKFISKKEKEETLFERLRRDVE